MCRFLNNECRIKNDSQTEKKLVKYRALHNNIGLHNSIAALRDFFFDDILYSYRCGHQFNFISCSLFNKQNKA